MSDQQKAKIAADERDGEQREGTSLAVEVSGTYVCHPFNPHRAASTDAALSESANDDAAGLDHELAQLLVASDSGEHTLVRPRSAAQPAREGSEAEVAALEEVERASIGVPIPLTARELRLDVDGRYPQMTASGNFSAPGRPDIHWIARLKAAGPFRWVGRIWYQHPATPLFAYSSVVIQVTPSVYAVRRRARVTFLAPGVRALTLNYRFHSHFFHRFEFEADQVTNAAITLDIDTGAHPNRPPSLPVERLSIREVYRRAGFDTRRRAGNQIDVGGAGANGTWSESEMHDAMQVHWSRFANLPQWSMWVLFAHMHDQGTSLGGIMFDDIGPNHRQGTAIFTGAFISQAPAGETAPAAWIERMRFWTAVHEMGHGFNLAHSWQKEHPADWGTPWIPTPNEVEARSFMNYPYSVSGGETAFFADFEFRFSDSELLFMRHAPPPFVEMGNANWFENHGFEQIVRPARSGLGLSLGVNRKRALYQFLEPIVLELKLYNHAQQRRTVDANVLSNPEALTVIIRKKNGVARQWRPYASYCLQRRPVELRPGQFIPESLFISAGTNGWDLSEPGDYTIQVALKLPTEDLVSNPLALRVAVPQSRGEERLAQDYFTDAVGRALSFDGTRELKKANDALNEVVVQLSDHPAAQHAKIALAMPMARQYKVLQDDHSFFGQAAQVEEAGKVAKEALLDSKDESAETLGHVDYAYYVDRFAGLLEAAGDKRSAGELTRAKQSVASSRRALDADIDHVLKTAPDAAAAE
jgi:hypothetical protein